MEKAIEYPDKPIPPEECVAADLRIIAAKRAFADELQEVPADAQRGPNWLTVFDAWKDMLLAEARADEIRMHNALWQAGMINRQQTGIVVPGMVPPNGRRQ